MADNEYSKNTCALCKISFHLLANSTNKQICQTCRAVFQINMKPAIKKSLELLRTITTEGQGFVEIDENEFIVEGVSGLGYRFTYENPFKMGVECYRSKDAALNWKDEAFLTPCIDLADESVEIPIGDLVFTYAMTLTNDVNAAEEIETLEDCISLRDSISFSPTQKEWWDAIEERRNKIRFGGPFPVVDEEDEIWLEEDFDFPADFCNFIDEDEDENDSSADETIVHGLSQRSQDRIDRFLQDLERI